MTQNLSNSPNTGDGFASAFEVETATYHYGAEGKLLGWSVDRNGMTYAAVEGCCEPPIIVQARGLRDPADYQGDAQANEFAYANEFLVDRGPYEWHGRELDADTALHSNRARYCDPSRGRFLGEK
jgi:hypothetical protein